MKVALSYRVLQHWRIPVFRRLASWPGIEFLAFYGADFPGTKAVSGRDLSGFEKCQLATIKINLQHHGDAAPLPIFPTLPYRLARFRPDVILAEGNSNFLNNFLVFAYATVSRTPVVFWTLGELPAEGRLSWSRRFFRWCTRAMEQRSAALLGYSSVALDYFRRQGYPAERQFRAVNCVDTDAVFQRIEAARSQVEALRDKYGLRGKQVLLYVGAIAPLKRLEDLIDVYTRLRSDHADVRLLIVGEGDHRPALQRYAMEQRADDVIFAGQVIEGVSAHFLLGDVFILPGLGGLAISEAMAHGLPVICTQADGCEVDLVEAGRNGYLLPVGDRDQLEQTLRTMLADPEQTRRMGEHSLWLIQHRYNIHTYMDNVVKALEYAHRSRRRAECRQVGHCSIE